MIDSKTIDNLARLARLSIPEEEKETLVKDINNMVEFIDVVQKVSLPNQGEMKFKQKNVARSDEVAPIDSAYDLVEAAPLHKDGFVQVPKVIG
ncbi:MAG TPA: Asp-tRNA(Asn)/Glu-tRNA(Gln) amidotransferase subunit GatC, partial [Candidatus Paceibacterota bacterium]|nr:Asp-tRNA(Asn)/Glu-tRNA(Gln) amidotransferase subunit GatC [Candidatus Paceibacterota bacterium]